MAPGFADAAEQGPVCSAGRRRTKSDYLSAAKWARRAAEAGSVDGQAVLGFILTAGPENLRDIEAGNRWYQKSAAGGCPQGQLGYALVLARDTSSPDVQEELLRHLSQAAEKGLATAPASVRHGPRTRPGRSAGPRCRCRVL